MLGNTRTSVRVVVCVCMCICLMISYACMFPCVKPLQQEFSFTLACKEMKRKCLSHSCKLTGNQFFHLRIVQVLDKQTQAK